MRHPGWEFTPDGDYVPKGLRYTPDGDRVLPEILLDGLSPAQAAEILRKL